MAGTELMHARSQSMNGIHHDTVISPEVKLEQPNGTVKGHAHSHSHNLQPSSMSMSRPNNMPPASTNTTATEPPSPSPPVLPQNMNGMVSLGAIIHRMTNEAFADLSNTSEILSSMQDPQKKHTLLDFTLSKREQFIKLLVLTKWAKSATKVQQCQNIIGFLQHENELFARAVGGLFETYKTFGRARVRNYDIPTAIDVLTTGSYQRLPTSVKHTYVGEEKPSRAEIAAALEKLDDVIRMRLLCDELVPPGMKYTIAKGKAKFVVPKEFEAIALIQSGWTDRLRLNTNQGSVRLVYWLTGHSPQSGPVQPVVPAPKRRSSTLPSAQAKEQASLQEHCLEFRIEEQPKAVQQIPEGLAGALVDPKLLGYPKSRIRVVWSQVVKGFVSQEEADTVLDMDPSNLNTERLILRAVNMHAGQVMQGFYDRLWTYIDNLKGPGQEGGYFSKEDVKLESVETEDLSSSSALSAGPQALLVRLKGDRWIRIRIDVRSGRVVVQEVGKTGDFDDPVISAFQSRLNENANNIVESLINLRFSMSIVELESVGIQLGLQPSKPLALSKQDMGQFGEGTQQLLYLQYPQHPRHYLVVGVVAHKFCVWLLEVTPMEKEIQGVWLTLKSIVPVYWQSLREKLNNDEDETMSRRMPSKRKSVQFDVMYEEDDEPSQDEELTIDQELLTKLEALCRVRICHNEVKQQMQEHGIQFRHLPSSRIKNEASPKSDTESSESLFNNVPLLRLDPNSISPGSTEGTFQSVGAKLTGWWDSQRETCNIVIQAKFFPDVIPPNMDSGPLSASERYYSKTNTLSFTYKTRGSFIQQFKQDWETIVRMLRVIRQLHAPTITNPHIKLEICHLHQVQLHYFGRYSINIKWVAAQIAEKRSSSGTVIPSAPRFKLGRYELLFGEVKPQKETPTKAGDGTDLFVNPHRRIKYFLQDMFNREADLHSLMNTVVQTCSILEVLDRLEHSVKEDATGTKMLSVIPRSAHHIRVVYGSKYALDIRAFSRTHISIFDASFPSESFGSSLPPPPAPSTAPALLTPPGRVIPPTTRGHLNYSAITNLQGVIGAIDVDKDDEEYIRSTMVTPSPASQASTPAPTLSTAAIIAAAKSNLKKEALPMVSLAAVTALHNVIDPRDDPYEIMPMPNGVICSRSASGRVMYRIAKHIDSIVPL
ncbi:mediator complex subunit [Podila epicladia]|nr:mediator complex subunit [Podila epicladia]